MTDSAETDGPWRKLPSESAKAYRAFSLYRDMGADRSITKVRQETGTDRRYLEKWSRKFDWVKRAAAFDKNIADRATKRVEDDLVEVRARHAAAAREIQDLAITRFQEMTEDELAEVPAHTLLKMVEVATKIELTALGEHTGDEIVIREGALEAASKHLIDALAGEDPEVVRRIIGRLKRGMNDDRGNKGTNTGGRKGTRRTTTAKKP